MDLRDTCLQGVDISDLDFDHALFDGAQMQGADLSGAQMQGADLSGAQMDQETSLSAATLRGAALREVDYSTVSISQEQVDQMFGDETAILPPAMTRPGHWPEKSLDFMEFYGQWRAWQKKIGYDPSKDTP